MFLSLNMCGLGWDMASSLKIYLWMLNYGCIFHSSYFSAFPRFSLVNRIRLFVLYLKFLKENMFQYLKYLYMKDLSKLWP